MTAGPETVGGTKPFPLCWDCWRDVSSAANLCEGEGQRLVERAAPLQSGGLPDHRPSLLQILCSDPPAR